MLTDEQFHIVGAANQARYPFWTIRPESRSRGLGSKPQRRRANRVPANVPVKQQNFTEASDLFHAFS